MLFKGKKIRELMGAIDAAKKPADLQKVTDAIEDQAKVAGAAFQQKLRKQLLLKHSQMAKVPNKKTADGAAKDGKFKMPKLGLPKFDLPKLPQIGFKPAYIAAVLVVALIAGAAGYPFIPAPEVQGYELKGSVRKISYNAPVTVTFNQWMDHGSTEKAFSIKPAVTGHFAWRSNSMMFYPDQQFKVGDTYEVAVAKGAKSIFQKNLRYDYDEVFQIVDAPKVLLVNPAKDSDFVDVTQKVTFMFDRPMTALTTLDAGLAQVPNIKFDPPVDGKYKWLGTNTISFTPTKLKYSTKYTVTIPKGTMSADNGMTDKDFSFSFTTLKPALVGTFPTDMDPFNGPDTDVRLSFNQPMNLSQANQFIHLYQYKTKDFKTFGDGGMANLKNFKPDDWQALDFTAHYYTLEDALKVAADANWDSGTTQETSELDEIKKDFNQDEALKTIVLVPNNKLTFNGNFLVKIDKDFAGTEGTFNMGDDQALLFKTVGDLQLVSYDPADKADFGSKMKCSDGECSGTYDQVNAVNLNFSQPVSNLDLDSKITLSPLTIDKDTKKEIPLGTSKVNDSPQVTLNYDFQPSTTYTVTVNPGIQDKYHQALQKATTFTFKTGPKQQGFDIASNGSLNVLDLNKPLVYYIKSVNINHVDFKWKELSMDEFNTFYNNGWVDPVALKNLSGPFQSFTKQIKSTLNEGRITKVDLVKDGGLPDKPGMYYLEGSNPNVPDSSGDNSGLSEGSSPLVIRQIFIVTGNSLLVKTSKKDVTVWATSDKDGSPVDGMNIVVRGMDPYSNKMIDIGTAVTDKNGLAVISIEKDPNAPSNYNIFGTKDGDTTMVGSSWEEGIAPWNFNITSSYYNDPYVTYAYTDRPIYRAGDTVYFKGFIREDMDATFKLPEADSSAHVSVQDPQGQSLTEQDIKLSPSGTFNGQLTLGDQAKTGYYSLMVYPSGEHLVSKSSPAYFTFRIAEYKKPDYKLDITPDKDNYINGDTAHIKVAGAYFFGAPLPKAPVDWTVSQSDDFFYLNPDINSPFAGQPYSFNDDGSSCLYGCQGNSAVVSSGSATLNDKGEYILDVPLNIKDSLSKLYNVEFTVHDTNNQTVSNRVMLPVATGEFHAGIMANDYLVNAGEKAKFDVITVDKDGQPVKFRDVEVTLYKRDWNTVQKKNVDSDFYYENNFEDVKIDARTARTDENGHASVEFIPKDAGDFKATVRAKDNRGNTVAATTYVYVLGDGYVNWGRDNNDRIELVADKTEYKPGDTAHIMIKSPYQDVWALESVERDGIISKKVVKIKTTTDTLDVPITEKSLPNVFVSVVMVKGDTNAGGLKEPPAGQIDERDVAAFKIGYTTLQVSTSSKKLGVDVTTDKKTYKPQDEVTIKVKTTDSSGKGRAADVSIAVVDKSVLSLAESTTSDLLTYFYRNRYLGLETAMTLTKALSRVNVNVESGLKGGGGDSSIKKRGEFKDTAFWQANVITDANGDATVKFKVPDNLTTWQIEAIGITNDTLVGSKKTDFVVSKDVLVRSVIPRFMITGDEIKIGGIVHNYLDTPANFDVSLEATGLKLNGSTQGISLNPGEEKKVEWDAEVLNDTEAKMTFKAIKTDDKNVGDILEQSVPIKPYSFPETVATSAVYSDNTKNVEKVWLPVNIDKNQGELTINVAPTLASAITKGIDYLRQFPYACVEQTASVLLPNAVIWEANKLPGLKNAQLSEKDLKANVESSLQLLYKYQNPNGGWGLWDTTVPNSYLTAYVLQALNETQKAGFSIDQGALQRGLDYLKGIIASAPIEPGNLATEGAVDANAAKSNANTRAYVLFVLSEMKSSDLGLMNNLYDHKDMLSIFAKAYLGMAYANVGGKDAQNKIGELKNEILANVKESPRGIHFEEAQNFYDLFDTNDRTTAVVLQLFARTDVNHPDVPKILRYMLMESNDQAGGRYMSTQEKAVGLLAMVDYLKASGELEPNYHGVVTVDGKSVIDKNYTGKNLGDKDSVTVALKDLLPDGADNEITATREGVGKMYFDMTLRYFLPTERIQPRDEGIAVTHEYYAEDDAKMEHPISEVQVGQNVRGKITIVVPETRYYVMVEDYLPAGLEAVDFSLNTAQQSLQNGGGKGNSYYEDPNNDYINFFNYNQVRDDRVMYYADMLQPGVYEINYFARATTPGVYHDLPALAQELYFPEVFGRSEGSMFTVKED